MSNPRETKPIPSIRSSRAPANVSPKPTAIVGGVAALLGGATLMFPTPDPNRPGFGFFTTCNVVAFVLLLVALAALWRLRVSGPGLLGRLGLATAAAALIGFTATEIATLSDSTIGEIVHPVTVPLLGIGMTAVGIAVIRAHVWRGWVRPAPLICGLVPLLIELPWFVAFGPNGVIIAVTWASWVLLGAAIASTSITGRGR